MAVVFVGVTAATSVFSVVDGTVLRPPPYGDVDRIVMVWGRNAQNGQLRDVISGPNYIDLRRGARSFRHLAAIKPDDLVLFDQDRPQVVSTLTATWEFFDALDVPAARGRTFTAADGRLGAEPVVVVSDALWRRRFGAAPDIVGRRLQTADGHVTVVGVLPSDFAFAARAEMFVPLHDDVLAGYDRTSYDYWLVGRLNDGTTIEQADDELEAVMARIRAEDPRLAGWSVAVEPLQPTVTEAVRPVLGALAGAVGVLLLVACANLGSLFLVHATALRSQFAVEAALGAGRWRIARRMATEALVVAGVGGVCGLATAAAVVRLLPRVAPPFVAIPGSAAQVVSFQASIDARVVFFALVVTVGAGLSGALPAMLAATAGGFAATLRSTGRSRTSSASVRRAHDAFVAAQVAFATLLLVAGMLGLGTFRNLLAADTGMRPDGVLTLYVGDLDDAGSEARALYFRRLVEAVEEVPGVLVVGVNDYVPLQAEDDFEGITLLDRPPPPPGQGVREEWRRVSEGYFDAAGIDVVAGRPFRRADFADGPTVAVVNETFVRRHFPAGDALGARMLIHEEDYGEAVVVGIVRDVRRRGVRENAPPVLYVPFHKHPRPNMALVVRTEGAADRLVEPVREAVWSVDPNQPIDRIGTMSQIVADAVGVPRLAMGVLLALAATASVLAGLGIFGVLAYAVRARATELGVRMALGASGADLQRTVVLRGVALCAFGAIIGAGLAVLAAGAAESLVYGIDVRDGAVIGPVAAMLLAVAALASWLPARRIGSIDPSETLRND
jgi:predicted permease